VTSEEAGKKAWEILGRSRIKMKGQCKWHCRPQVRPSGTSRELKKGDHRRFRPSI